MMRSIVVAVADNGVIGNDNKMLWHLRDDMKHFRRLTTGHFIIMGRKTFESIGKPLPERTNIVISRNPDFKARDILVKKSLEEAFRFAAGNQQEEVFIIGGAEIYRHALPFTDKIYYTKVEGSFQGDAVFPDIQPEEWEEKVIGEFTRNDKNDRNFKILELSRIKAS